MGLDFIAYALADFAYSKEEPLCEAPYIRSRRPYYYFWRGDRALDIFTFDDPGKPDTAKLFEYSLGSIRDGIDLDRDTPVLSGAAAAEFLLLRWGNVLYGDAAK